MEKELLFFSNRNGVFNVFKQNESTSSADPVVSGRKTAGPPNQPDGQWLLYMVWPDDKAPGPVRVMRANGPSGGSPDSVLEGKGSFATGVAFTAEGEQDIQKEARPGAFQIFVVPRHQKMLPAFWLRLIKR